MKRALTDLEFTVSVSRGFGDRSLLPPLAVSIRTVYGFYRRNRFYYQQYISCLDPLGEPRGRQPYSLTPDLYGKFLCDLFDLWYRDLSDKKPSAAGQRVLRGVSVVF